MKSHRSDTAPGFTGWRGVILACCAVFAVLFSLEAQLEQDGILGVFGQNIAGRYGIFAILDPKLPAGYLRVTGMVPGGAGEKAGLQPGDGVRFTPVYAPYQTPQVGQALAITITRNGEARQGRLVVVAPDLSQKAPTAYAAFLMNMISSLVLLGFSILLLWRGWRRWPPVLLGFALIGYGYNTHISHWAVTPFLALGYLIVANVINSLLGLLLTFVLSMYHTYISPVSRIWWRINLGMIVSMLIIGQLSTYSLYNITLLPFGIDAGVLSTGLAVIGIILTLYLCLRGWTSSNAEGAKRFGVVLLAFCVALSAQVLIVAFPYVTGNTHLSGTAYGLVTYLLVYFAMPGLLAYAVLRHRIVDPGFVINRTLVYGVVSFLLLASFGVLEWAAEHVLPESIREKSAWIDGGIAVGIFLTFHRVRDAVESAIEHLFFHRWKQNEARLKRFVAAAPHFDQAHALCTGFAEEIARFSDGASLALYVREAEGGYVRAAGDMEPEGYASDDSAFALMRAERSPLDVRDGGLQLSGALALPMLDHGILTGFVLLDLPPGGRTYRPDEVELLGWAANQVGLDLQTLRVRELETENRILSAQNEKLSSLLATRLTNPA